MTKKELPKVRKSFKSFLKEEDAKLIDKSMSKVALTLTFASISALFTLSDVHAKGASHTNSTSHGNALSSLGTESDMVNNAENVTTKTLPSATGGTFSEDLPSKSVTSVHSNHYNHNNNVSGGGCI
jgi:hypothetical protein